MIRRALFLDRDGVVNEDRGYVHRREDFVFMDGIFDLCRLALAHGHEIFIITNQAGIARGYYTEDDFHELTRWMLTVFANEGAPIRKVYYCPYHPTAGIGRYRVDAECRKPRPGMILAARDEFGLDLAASTLIGDRETDIEAGTRAGVGRNLLVPPLDGSAAGSPVRDVMKMFL